MTTKALISLLVIGLLLTSVVFAVASENTENKEVKNRKTSENSEKENTDEGFFGVVMQILAVLFGK